MEPGIAAPVATSIFAPATAFLTANPYILFIAGGALLVTPVVDIARRALGLYYDDVDDASPKAQSLGYKTFKLLETISSKFLHHPLIKIASAIIAVALVVFGPHILVGTLATGCVAVGVGMLVYHGATTIISVVMAMKNRPFVPNRVNS